MNRIKLLLLASTMAGVGTVMQAARAQEAPTMEDVRHAFDRMDRARIDDIGREMALPLPQARKFWPAYNAHLRAEKALRERQLAALVAFADALNSNALDEATASHFLDESMATENLRVNNRHRFIRRLGEFLTPQQQMRLYQMEALHEAQVRAGLLRQIPLAE